MEIFLLVFNIIIYQYISKKIINQTSNLLPTSNFFQPTGWKMDGKSWKLVGKNWKMVGKSCKYLVGNSWKLEVDGKSWKLEKVGTLIL